MIAISDFTLCVLCREAVHCSMKLPLLEIMRRYLCCAREAYLWKQQMTYVTQFMACIYTKHVTNVSIFVQCGWTPLHDAVCSGEFDTVKKLLQFGCHVNCNTTKVSVSVCIM